MNPDDRDRRLRELFDQALDLPAAERSTFLDRACGDDPDLRADVGRLLARHERAEGFLEPPPAGPASDPHPRGRRIRCPHCRAPIEIAEGRAPGQVTCPACGSSFRVDQAGTPTWGPGRDRFGRFELLRLVGEGSYGYVYAASDPKLRRVVALKLPRNLDALTAEDRARFFREARNAARLHHASIVTVFEVDEHEGVPYIVSEIVEGVSLDHRLSDPGYQPGFREVAALVAELAEAFHYAHGRGVIHRDIKPANILIDASDRPRVTDFGLAKRDAGEVSIAEDGRPLGSPAYMSPEAARGEAHQADARSDVYSLGVVLYQLTTGVLPFQGTWSMMLHHHLHSDPRPLRTLNNRIPRDLETACLKAMEKSSARRYQTAGDLADDLRRWLRGEPIHARPLGRPGRSWRWCLRNPALATTAAIAAMALLAIVALSITIAVVQVRAADRYRMDGESIAGALAQVKNERDNVRKEQEKTKAALAQVENERDNARSMLDFLLRTFRTADALGPLGLEGLAFRRGDEPGREMTAAKILTRGISEARSDFRNRPLLLAQLLDAIGHVYRSWGDYTQARTLLEEALRLRRESRASPRDIAISLRGVGRCHHDQGNYEKAERNYTDALDIQRQHLGEHDPEITKTKFYLAWLVAERRDPSGEALVREVLEERIRRFGAGAREVALVRLGLAMLLSDQKRHPEAWGQWRLATPALDQELVRAVSTGILAMRFRSWGQYRSSVAFLDKAREILRKHLGNRHPYVGLMLNLSAFDLSKMGRRAEAEQGWRECLDIARETVGLGHPIAIEPVRYLALLLAESADRPQGKEEGESLWREILKERVARFGPRHYLSTEARFGLARFLEDHGGPGRAIEARRLFEQANPQLMMDKDPDPRFPVQVHYGGREEGEVPDSIRPMTAFSPDGSLYVSAGDRPSARVYDRSRGVCVGELRLPGTWIESAAFTADSRGLVTAGRAGTLQFWPVPAAPPGGVGPVRHLASTGGPVSGLAVAQGGERVITCGIDGVIRIWELATGRRLGEWKGPLGACSGSFSADGEKILAGYSNGEVRLWSVARPNAVRVFSKHEGPVMGCSFLPGEGRLISWAKDGNVRVWDVESRQPIESRFDGQIRDGHGVAVSADGRWTLSAHADETLLLRERTSGWKVQQYEFRLPYLKSQGNPRGVGVSFSPDGQYAACAGFRGLVYLVQLPRRVEAPLDR
jgi:tetratricopeptide (TPR) repeat protein